MSKTKATATKPDQAAGIHPPQSAPVRIESHVRQQPLGAETKRSRKQSAKWICTSKGGLNDDDSEPCLSPQARPDDAHAAGPDSAYPVTEVAAGYPKGKNEFQEN